MSAVSTASTTILSGRSPLPGRTLLLTGLCLLVFLAGAGMTDILIYNRAAVESGEWWRIITGQFVHIGWDHIFWDVGAFISLAWMIETASDKKRGLQFWSVMLAGLLPVGLFIHYASNLPLYCGMSGALNTLFAIVLYDMWQKDRMWLYPAFLAGNGLKIVTEIWLGGALFTETALPTFPQAHAVGYVCGFIWIYLNHRRHREK